VLGMLAEITLFPVIGANLDTPRSPLFLGAVLVNLLISAATLIVSRRLKKKKENPVK